MKKFKNYILMLLVPLILLGCVSKGVSDAVEDTTDSNLGGYTVSQLEYMATDTNNARSITNNISQINELLNNTTWSSQLDSTEILAVKTHKTFLYSLLSGINNLVDGTSSSFNVTTSLSNLNTNISTAMTSLDLFSLSEIETINEQIENALADLGTDTTTDEYIYYSALSGANQTILNVTIPNTLSNVVNYLTTTVTNNTNKTGSYNIFYSNIYHLTIASLELKKNKTLLKSALGVDIDNIDLTAVIKAKLSRMTTELNRLNSSYVQDSVILKSADLTYINNAYTDLKSKYNAYTSSTPISVITNAEYTFRGKDNNLIGTTFLSTYESKLDSVYSKIGTFPNTDIYNAIKSYLTEYNTVKSAYSSADFDNNNTYFSNSISKTVNVVYIYNLLKTEYWLEINAIGVSL